MMEKTWVTLGGRMIGRESTCAKIPPPTQDFGPKLFWKLCLPARQPICPELQLQLRFKLQLPPSVCASKIPYGAPCHHD